MKVKTDNLDIGFIVCKGMDGTVEPHVQAAGAGLINSDQTRLLINWTDGLDIGSSLVKEETGGYTRTYMKSVTLNVCDTVPAGWFPVGILIIADFSEDGAVVNPKLVVTGCGDDQTCYYVGPVDGLFIGVTSFITKRFLMKQFGMRTTPVEPSSFTKHSRKAPEEPYKGSERSSGTSTPGNSQKPLVEASDGSISVQDINKALQAGGVWAEARVENGVLVIARTSKARTRNEGNTPWKRKAEKPKVEKPKDRKKHQVAEGQAERNDKKVAGGKKKCNSEYRSFECLLDEGVIEMLSPRDLRECRK